MIKKKLTKEQMSFVKDCELFFDIKLDVLPFIVEVDTRNEFNKILSWESSPSWVVGFSIHPDVLIFSKESFEKESSHKLSERESVIKHEIVHLFFKKKTGGHTPLWLNEGLAMYLSGQRQQEMNVGVEDLVSLYSIGDFKKDKLAYRKAYNLVKKILE